MNPPELKLRPPRLVPAGVVAWGLWDKTGFVPFVAANDDHPPFPADPAAPVVVLPAPPKPQPKLTIV